MAVDRVGHEQTAARVLPAARLLVGADLRGVDSHGAHLMGLYVVGLRSGDIDPRARPTVVHDGGSTMTIDRGAGHRGPGREAVVTAAEIRIEFVAPQGTGGVRAGSPPVVARPRGTRGYRATALTPAPSEARLGHAGTVGHREVETVSDRYELKHFRTELGDTGVLHVRLDRPERRNAITPEMHDEIAPLFHHIAADRAVKVIVITGSGDESFCVGADFSGMQQHNDAGGYPDGHPGLMHGSAAVVRSQLAVPQPMIAAINGDAMGLGATLALFCDITLMADSARIGEPHVKAGLVAGDGGTVLWPLLLGLNRGKEYLFTGDIMTAAQALEYGLVNHVHPAAELAAKAAELAERIAAGPQIAVQFNKRLANADLVDRVNRVLDASLAMEAITFGTADHREAVTAFLGKRTPRFGIGG